MSQSTDGEIRAISLAQPGMHLQRGNEMRFVYSGLQRLETADANHFYNLLASLFRAV
jgi:hypothetical protein